MADRNHSMGENNKSSRVWENVLLWSKLWLWAKVSTLNVIMFAGRWECGRGVLWDFHRALGWIVSLWIWWETGRRRAGGWETFCSCGQEDASLSHKQATVGPVPSSFVNIHKHLLCGLCCKKNPACFFLNLLIFFLEANYLLLRHLYLQSKKAVSFWRTILLYAS